MRRTGQCGAPDAAVGSPQAQAEIDRSDVAIGEQLRQKYRYVTFDKENLAGVGGRSSCGYGEFDNLRHRNSDRCSTRGA
jgi:hypothetical protein